MALVYEQLFILYLFMVTGWLIGKKKNATHCEILSVLLVNILLPCKVFLSFATNFTVNYFKVRYTYLFASLILITVLYVSTLFGSKLLTKHPYQRKVFRYCLMVTNYAYLGYVLIEAVFGSEMLADFIFFAIPFIIYTYSFGYSLLTGGKKPLKRLLNPITFAILLGMLTGLTKIPVPAMLTKAMTMASGCVGPISMLLTGLTFAAFSAKTLFSNRKAYIFSALRLIIIPGIVFLVCTLLRLDTVKPMMLLITCMPCGLNSIAFPKLINEDCKLSAQLTLLSHLLAIPTLLFWISLII